MPWSILRTLGYGDDLEWEVRALAEPCHLSVCLSVHVCMYVST